MRNLNLAIHLHVIHQTAKLKSPPNKPRIWYVAIHNMLCNIFSRFLAHAWFLEITFMRTLVCVRVCVSIDCIDSGYGVYTIYGVSVCPPWAIKNYSREMKSE